MAVVQRRRRFGFGADPVSNYVSSLPFAYAGAFPGVDFASLSPDTTIGDLLHSGAISQAEYESAFGQLPTVANTASDYATYVAWIKGLINSGQATANSLDGVTPQWYVDNRTPLATSATMRAGGYTVSDTGAIQSTDAQGNVTGTISQSTAPKATTPTGPKEYLQQGIDFLDNGSVKSVNGTMVTGKTLTSDQMQRLLTGGTLTAAEIAALLPPPTSSGATTMPTTQPPSGGTSNVIPQTTVSLVPPGPTDLGSANTDSAGTPVVPPTSAPINVPAEPASLFSSPLVLAGLAAVAFLVLSRKKRHS